MIVYADTSALVKLFVREEWADEVISHKQLARRWGKMTDNTPEAPIRTQVAIFVISILGAALGAATTIVADFAVRLNMNSLPVCGGTLLVMGGLMGLMGSSFAANFGIPIGYRHERFWTLLLTAMFLLPAILTGAACSQWVRALLALNMTMGGWVLGWITSNKVFSTARAHSIISQLRPGLALAFVMFGALVYVVAPSIEIVGR